MKIVGNMASAIRSSPAYWYILTDKVSKSNGLSMKVIGNSLMVSTNTNSAPTKNGPLSNGRSILLMIENQFEPKPLAASSRLGGIRSSPESIDPLEIVKNLTIYPQRRRQIAMKLNFEVEILINERAKTVPGIA